MPRVSIETVELIMICVEMFINAFLQLFHTLPIIILFLYNIYNSYIIIILCYLEYSVHSMYT